MELDQAIVAFLIGKGKGLRAAAPLGPQSIVSLPTVWFVIFHAEGAFGAERSLLSLVSGYIETPSM